jgi:hypothetical protein
VSDSTAALYVRDLGTLLERLALQAKSAAAHAPADDRAFALGRLMRPRFHRLRVGRGIPPVITATGHEPK